MVDVYGDLVARTDRGPLFWLFLSLLLTFLVTRFVTRWIRAGSTGLKNRNVGGVHIHHQVFGIIAVLLAGCLEFTYRPASPWSDVLGAVYGAGVALTLDEFALWLYMDDVYWTEAGRRPGSAKLASAEVRFGPAYQMRWNRVRDLVGGAPSRPSSG